MHRFKHGRVLPRRIDIGRWRDTDGPCDGRPQIREDVPKKIASHHHVKPVRMKDKIGGQYVDVILVNPNIWIRLCHGSKAFIPKGHGVHDPV